jgi:ubiquinone/menaquinone biosynthesis C-methylase UbiE
MRRISLPAQAHYWRTLPPSDIPSTLEASDLLTRYSNPQCRVLDLGCGCGHTLSWLVQRGVSHLVGIDLNEGAVRIARRRAAEEAWPKAPLLLVADARMLPLQSSSIDCVVTQAFWTTIVAEDHRSRIAQEIARVLRPSGTLYISDFLQNWRLPVYKRRYEEGQDAGLSRGTFAVPGIGSSQATHLVHHYSFEELRSLLCSTGMVITEKEIRNVRTRSGNCVAGIILIARKQDHVREG